MRRSARGSILLLVLLLLLVLTVLAAAVLQSSASHAVAFNSSRNQSQALINSSTGLQEGIARLRSGQVAWRELATCAIPEGCGMAPPPFVFEFTPPAVPPTPATRAYRVTIFQRPRIGTATLGFTGGQGNTVVVVSSTGFAIGNEAFSVVTEAEVQMPDGTQGGNTNAGGS
jgi:hypothetical protein